MTSELEKDIVSAIGRPDPVILDVGCNDGSDTLAFLNLFPNAQIFCFEPDPRARARFRARVDDPRARLFSVALGAEDRVKHFYQSNGLPSPELSVKLPEGWDLSGSLRRPKNHLSVHPWCTFDREIFVSVRCLDTWADAYGIGDVDFIWADVQGAEGDLVHGGTETLKRVRYFFTEYSDQELYEGQPTLAQLRAMLPSFEVVKIYPEDVLFRNASLT